MKRAIEEGYAEINYHDPRKFASDKHNRVDDYQFGGGAGMVMMVEPLANCLDSLLAARTYDEVIYMTPDGKRFNQRVANKMSSYRSIIIVCGHYKGIDQRIRDHYITQEISIGDFVISGGELAAAVVCDAIIRLIPGVLGDGSSALSDSFQDQLLAPPVYTRPAEFRGWRVPEILTSGNTKEIEKWRHNQALQRTTTLRPDLLDE